MSMKKSSLFMLILLAGCAAPPKIIQSQMEIQAYQSHEFEATKRVVFDSTMSVLQDSGFIIESADFDTGFITGKGTTESRNDIWWGAMNEHVKMTAFVEQRNLNYDACSSELDRSSTTQVCLESSTRRYKRRRGS